MESDDILRRYTSLPVAIDMLVRKCATLLPYRHWVDENDRRALELYQNNLHYGFVGAMCLTQAAETFHHWQVFASGDAGVCVVFDRLTLERHFADRMHFKARPVQYMQMREIETIDAADLHDLPFLKRYGFRDEREFRILGYTVEQRPSLSFEIIPGLIRRIVFSPFTHPSLVDSARIALRAIPGWSGLTVHHSKLINNETWQAALSGFVSRHGTVYGEWIEIEFEEEVPDDTKPSD